MVLLKILDFAVLEIRSWHALCRTNDARGHGVGRGRWHVPLYRRGRIHAFPSVEMGTIKGWGSVMVCGTKSLAFFSHGLEAVVRLDSSR